MRVDSKVRIGDVPTFRDVEPSKEQALKVLEEAAEVFGAWQLWDAACYDNARKFAQVALLDECSDVVQATCNLVAAFGIVDFTSWVDACKRRNEKRGRM